MNFRYKNIYNIICFRLYIKENGIDEGLTKFGNRMNSSLVRYKVVDQHICLPQVWTFLWAGQALNTCLHHKIYLTFNTEVSFILFHEGLYLQCSITHLLLQYLGPLSSAKTAALVHPTLAHRLGSLGWRENSLSSHSPTSRELRGLTNVSVHEF